MLIKKTKDNLILTDITYYMSKQELWSNDGFYYYVAWKKNKEDNQYKGIIMPIYDGYDILLLLDKFDYSKIIEPIIDNLRIPFLQP